MGRFLHAFAVTALLALAHVAAASSASSDEKPQIEICSDLPAPIRVAFAVKGKLYTWIEVLPQNCVELGSYVGSVENQLAADLWSTSSANWFAIAPGAPWLQTMARSGVAWGADPGDLLVCLDQASMLIPITGPSLQSVKAVPLAGALLSRERGCPGNEPRATARFKRMPSGPTVGSPVRHVLWMPEFEAGLLPLDARSLSGSVQRRKAWKVVCVGVGSDGRAVTADRAAQAGRIGGCVTIRLDDYPAYSVTFDPRTKRTQICGHAKRRDRMVAFACTIEQPVTDFIAHPSRESAARLGHAIGAWAGGKPGARRGDPDAPVHAIIGEDFGAGAYDASRGPAAPLALFPIATSWANSPTHQAMFEGMKDPFGAGRTVIEDALRRERQALERATTERLKEHARAMGLPDSYVPDAGRFLENPRAELGRIGDMATEPARQAASKAGELRDAVGDAAGEVKRKVDCIFGCR